MSSFLTTTAKMVHSSRLPASTTRAQALAMLADYEFFLSCDPHLQRFELIPPSDATNLNPPLSIPDTVKSQLRSGAPAATSSSPSSQDSDNRTPIMLPTCYRVTDVVHAIPAGIWDTNVVSTYEFTLIRDGIFVRIRSPLSVVIDTFWEIREAAAKDDDGGDKGVGLGGLELVEDMTITCSRLLVGLVKGQCEAGWAGIHAKMIARLEGEVGNKGVGEGIVGE
ncbi:uncharacterized protein B0T15DRAFT_519109 [Chaetomium strumarium]|uniref:DUF7053 domain-containing protein n=1 Tax=Chaetomium strumarium TaxID=1170767 RepID=A0AAJ0H2K8_9PEZI|nr:hypothetical protein B0T15DRAFT_519109 [Chaetomium strumarium]